MHRKVNKFSQVEGAKVSEYAGEGKLALAEMFRSFEAGEVLNHEARQMVVDYFLDRYWIPEENRLRGAFDLGCAFWRGRKVVSGPRIEKETQTGTHAPPEEGGP